MARKEDDDCVEEEKEETRPPPNPSRGKAEPTRIEIHTPDTDSADETVKVDVQPPALPSDQVPDPPDEVRHVLRPKGTSGEDHWKRVEREEKPKTNWSPTSKVASGAAAGNVAVILLWIAAEANLDVPPEVAGAFAALLSLAVAYLVPEGTKLGRGE